MCLLKTERMNYITVIAVIVKDGLFSYNWVAYIKRCIKERMREKCNPTTQSDKLSLSIYSFVATDSSKYNCKLLRKAH